MCIRDRSLVGVAVELRQPRGYGRCRMMILRDGSAASLHPFVIEYVEPGATVITDAWKGYSGINKLLYPRTAQPTGRGQDPGELLPGVHRVASLVKRWLQLGTHQGWARSTKRTYRATSTSSCSASTGADPGAGGWSSTACSNSPSRTIQCDIATWPSTRSRRRRRPCRRAYGGTRRAWTAHERRSHGEHPDLG